MFKAPKHVHCIGIGGIAISGIAKLLHAQGVSVSGSDVTASEITADVEKLGVAIAIGHAAQNIPAETDLVIFSEAVPEEDPERGEAKRRGIKERSGAAFLAEWSEGKKLIAVSGTNGKSTTTAMIGCILEKAGLDPTVLVGSLVPSFPLGNVRVGKSDLFVLEADEYRAKFLHYRPDVIVLTNVEADHLDFFTDLQNITDTFNQYLTGLKPGGTVVLNADDKILGEIKVEEPAEPLTYGIEHDARYRASRLRIENGTQYFEVHRAGEELGWCALKIPGSYNVENALAAIAAADSLGVPFEVIRESLGEFKGIWRRFEILGEYGGATIISDYGHHPTSVHRAVSAAREFYPGRRIVLVFQPHQKNRTQKLFSDFVAAIRTADLAIIPDIYHVVGREEAEKVTSEDLVRAAESDAVIVGGTLAASLEKVKSSLKPNDIVLFMGAGDIDSIAREIVRRV